MLADLLKDDDNRFLIDVEYKRYERLLLLRMYYIYIYIFRFYSAHKFTTILVLSIQRADSLQSCSYSLVEVILVVWSFLVVTTKANLLFPMLRYDSDGEIEIELTETISKKFTSVTIGTEKTK